MKKIRITTMPSYIVDILDNDAKDFGFTQNGFCNKIFSIYARSSKDLKPLENSENLKEIQFNLNKENEEIYELVLKEYGIKNGIDLGTSTNVDFFKKVFFDYINMPKYKREMIVFDKKIDILSEAINTKKKMIIKYKNTHRIVEPYFIKYSGGESRNYICVYCEKNQEYRNYGLKNIEVTKILDEKQEKFDKEYIEVLKENFDPFLSFNKKVVVKLTEEGKKHYDKIVTNRPDIIEIKEDVYIFRCSDEKAKIYFPHFWNEAEIIEPQYLREWFENKLSETLNKYKESKSQ